MSEGRQPKIAIYMSCYNHEKYVGEAMESIIGQTYPHWELFVANDGSTDKSGEVIASYKDDRIHYYDLPENTQLVGAMNLLFDEIKDRDFDYVQSMASDDLLEVRKLEKQIEFFKKHPQYAACFTWDKVIFSDGAKDYDGNYSHVKNRSRYAWLCHFYLHGNCLNANSALVRKDVFYEMGTMNQRYIVLADFRLWDKIASKYPIYVMQEELTYYRRHDTNISNTTVESALCTMQEHTQIMKQVIGGLDAKTFMRAFFPLLAYKHCASREELEAEIMILFANGESVDRRQAAIEWFFEHSDDRGFAQILKEQYGFENRDFTNLKRNAGLPYAYDDVARMSGMETFMSHNPVKLYHAWQILMHAIQSGKTGTDTLERYTYNVLLQLYIMGLSNEQAMQQFRNVRELFRKMRTMQSMAPSKRKVLFLVADSSGWRPVEGNIPFPLDESIEYYLAVVRPQDVLVANKNGAGNTAEGLAEAADCVITAVDLFDEENQCLLFADEEIEHLTDICYVDCMEDEYECREMVGGFALSCKQYCIMERDCYDKLMAVPDFKMVSEVMEDVYCYG